MNKKGNNDYLVPFKGVKLSKREANKVGLGIICGVIGMFVCLVIPSGISSKIEYIIILGFASIGYFGLGNKIFKE